MISFEVVLSLRTEVGELYDYNLIVTTKTFNNKSKGHRNEMIIWVALNGITKRIVTTLPSHTIRIICFERRTIGLINLITAEGLFDWSIIERMLHSRCLNKFDFVFQSLFKQMSLSLQPNAIYIAHSKLETFKIATVW
ncbi:MAG: hypothetical protein ACTS5A_01300 [Candidatus Hodgkinia cicadicola]